MVTAFQSRVYERLSEIPKGKVATYKDVARSLGLRSGRAVGQACRRNPFAPRVPCHRVVLSDGRIGGFAGSTSRKRVSEKTGLLREEGVSVRNGRILDFERVRHVW